MPLENDKRCCVLSVSLCVLYISDAEIDICLSIAIYTVNRRKTQKYCFFLAKANLQISFFFGDSNFFIRLGQHSCRTERSTATR